MAVKIEGVAQGSPALQAGLQAGMVLCSIDGHEINDGLDYEFYSAPATLDVVLEKEGQPICAVVDKAEYEPLGLEFASYLIDKQHTCRNKCVFCFIDQMPKGMRPSLYFKDDDERLSFLFGNYITLTNLTEKEIQRIITMRISPVNISVHTTNPPLRVEMMGNRFAGEVLRFIPMLAKAGIQLNTQLVLCPGVNDGDELRRSIEWLAQYRPALQSIAAVPVGLTRFRQGLHTIAPYTAKQAATQLDIMLEYGNQFKQEEDLRIVYPSDEWFLLAGRPMPEEDFYDGYPQLENGVGMWRLLHDEFICALADRDIPEGKREVDLVVGTLAYPLYIELAEQLHKKMPLVNVHVHAVQNNFFGDTITVTGLVTGQDIVAQVKGKLKTKHLLLPDVMLRAEGDVLLDDTTPEDLEKELSVQVGVAPMSGEELLACILA